MAQGPDLRCLVRGDLDLGSGGQQVGEPASRGNREMLDVGTWQPLR